MNKEQKIKTTRYKMVLTTNKSHQKCKALQVWKNKILKVKITREIGLSIPRVNSQQKKSN